MIQVKLVNYTPNPERTVAIAARTCIKNIDYDLVCLELNDEDIRRILKTVILNNHHSVLEHIYFTFSISGVSRVLTHQLIRHRIASYSQLSQQRTDSSRLRFTTPPEIENRPDLAEEYCDMMIHCKEFYKRLIQCGINRGSARYILPQGFNTRILVTINARSLFNLLAQRECAVEQWEFRQVADLMHSELMRVAPGIFKFAGPPCETHNSCPEGENARTCKYRKKVLTGKGNSADQVESQIIHV